MALKLVRTTEIPLWDISHSKKELEDAEAENFTSYLLNYEGKEEAQDPSKAAYKHFSEKMWPEGNCTDIDYFPDWRKVPDYGPVALCCDFNRSPHCWALGQSHPEWLLVFDQIWSEDALTSEQAAKAVKTLLRWGIEYVELYGDATGKSKGRAKKSDWDRLTEALEAAGISYRKRVPRSNPYRSERVKEANNLIYSGKDADNTPRRRFVVHKRCSEVIDDYKYSSTGDDGEKLKKQGDRGHMSDAVDYWLYRKVKGTGAWTYIR